MAAMENVSSSKIAVVTGSNKGIGFEIVRQLSRQAITTVLTARDEKRGLEAVESLKAQNLEVHFHQLDVSDSTSVANLAAWLRSTFKSIDILVNNAGITSKSFDDRVKGAEAVLNANYYGAKRVTEALVPMIKPGGRIINVSSRLGQIESSYNPFTNEFQREKLLDVDNLNEEVIESCLQEFMAAVRRGKLREEGYPPMSPDYSMSKSALNAYTRILAPRLAKNNISVNAMCPGYTKTDMTDGQGTLTVEQGADTAVWLATLQSEGDYPSGKFWAERKEIPF